jgi:predicted metal-dependent TIM-barrel fold hydrolase
MVSRTTDDYQRLADAGVVAVSEPAFWPGWDRTGVESFVDYFRQLTEFEPKRAAAFGIKHYTWICVNAKEAENVSLSREVLKVIPEFLDHPNVLGIGEIGLNKNTKNELTIFEEHVELALRRNELILIHTPHLQDKYKGTCMILDALKNQGADPSRVLVDHVEEHTVGMVKDEGYWCGMTIYPTTKCTPKRAVDIIERWGTDQIMVNSAGDWGISDPMNTPRTLQEFTRRGHSAADADKIFHGNPASFFAQSPKWQL